MSTRFWFDTRANLRREMEDRKKRFEERNEVRGKLAEVLKKLSGGATFFNGLHIFTPNADVPDDSALRLVYLTPVSFTPAKKHVWPSKLCLTTSETMAPSRATGAIVSFSFPPIMARLHVCATVFRVALAWVSIVEDIDGMRLILDPLQMKQARKNSRPPKKCCRGWLGSVTNGFSVQFNTQPQNPSHW